MGLYMQPSYGNVKEIKMNKLPSCLRYSISEHHQYGVANVALYYYQVEFIHLIVHISLATKIDIARIAKP
ncbi:MAG: hypothetical protein ABI185_05540 [Ginsengibacter sp.]